MELDGNTAAKWLAGAWLGFLSIAGKYLWGELNSKVSQATLSSILADMEKREKERNEESREYRRELKGTVDTIKTEMTQTRVTIGRLDERIKVIQEK